MQDDQQQQYKQHAKHLNKTKDESKQIAKKISMIKPGFPFLVLVNFSINIIYVKVCLLPRITHSPLKIPRQM